MKKLIYCLAGISAIMMSQGVKAQFISGPVFIVKANTPVVIDSFDLQPAVDITLPNTQITNSYTPVPAVTPGNGSIARVTTINPPVNFRGAVGISYINPELNGNTPATLNLVYHTGASGYSLTNLVTTSNLNNHVVGTTGVNTITIGKITAVDAGIVLPLQLLSFVARKVEQTAFLEWTTVNEKNVDRFEVEKAVENNGNFTTMSTLKAKGGNSQQQQLYNYTDHHPVMGWNYYRLKIIEENGNATYSRVVALLFDENGNMVTLYPNPVKQQLYVSLNSDKAYSGSWRLTDVLGRLVNSQSMDVQKGSNLFTIDMQSLSSGSYTLQLDNGFVSKIVKE